MIEAVESDRKLTTEMRARIALALDCLFITMLIEDHSTPGRRRSLVNLHAARLMHVLVIEHDAMIRTAAVCVLPGARDEKDLLRMERAYRTIRDSAHGFRELVGPPHPETLAKAIARLPARRKSGNK
jgi:hypothetical protein